MPVRAIMINLMCEAITPPMRVRRARSCTIWFIRSAAVILAATGLAKIWSSFGQARLLVVPDPLVGIEFGSLMLIIGIAEVVVAGICLLDSASKRPLVLVAWLATSFVVYRSGLWWIGWTKPCGCLGNLTDSLHIPPQAVDTIMKLVLAYLLIGSYATLFCLWRTGHKSSVAAPFSTKAAKSVS